MPSSPPVSINTIGGAVGDGATVVQVYAPGHPGVLTQDFISDAAAAAFSPEWLQFHQARVPLLGREAELSRLREFLDDPRPFAWWAVHGPAGAGKSRLGLELLRSCEGSWDGGFVPGDSQSAGSVAGWVPGRDTLWVFDYAAGSGNRLATVLKVLAGSAAQFPHKLRLLLLEREAGRTSSWWHNLIDAGGAQAGLLRATLFGEPLELLPVGALAEPLLASWLVAAGWVPDRAAAAASQFGGQDLLRSTDGGRPLLVALVAAALWQGEPMDETRKRMPSESMDRWLIRELRLMQDFARDRAGFEGMCYLLLLATFGGGLRPQPDAADARMPALPEGTLDMLAEAIRYTDPADCLQRLAQAGITARDGWALVPDALGERLLELCLFRTRGIVRQSGNLPAYDPTTLGCLLHRATLLGDKYLTVLARLGDELVRQALTLIAHDEKATMRLVMILMRNVARLRGTPFDEDDLRIFEPALWGGRFDPILHRLVLGMFPLRHAAAASDPEVQRTLALLEAESAEAAGGSRVLWVVPFLCGILGLRGPVLGAVSRWYFAWGGVLKAARAREVMLALELMERFSRDQSSRTRTEDGSFWPDPHSRGAQAEAADVLVQAFRCCFEAAARLWQQSTPADRHDLGQGLMEAAVEASYALLGADCWAGPTRQRWLQAAFEISANALRGPWGQDPACNELGLLCIRNTAAALDLLRPGEGVERRLALMKESLEAGRHGYFRDLASDGIRTAARTGDLAGLRSLTEFMSQHPEGLQEDAARFLQDGASLVALVEQQLQAGDLDAALEVASIHADWTRTLPPEAEGGTFGALLQRIAGHAAQHVPGRLSELTALVEGLVPDAPEPQAPLEAMSGGLAALVAIAQEHGLTLPWMRLRSHTLDPEHAEAVAAISRLKETGFPDAECVFIRVTLPGSPSFSRLIVLPGGAAPGQGG